MEITTCTANDLLSSTSSSWLKPIGTMATATGDSTSTTSATTSNAMKVLPVDYELNEYDVFCGRGSRCWNHAGNKRFRQRVEEEIVNYSQAKTKYCKTAIICKIIDEVRQLSPNGGFLRQDSQSGRYIEVGDFLAVRTNEYDEIKNKHDVRYNLILTIFDALLILYHNIQREKTSQAFRDALQGTYKSSNARKRIKRIESQTSMLQQKHANEPTNLFSLLSHDVLTESHLNENHNHPLLLNYNATTTNSTTITNFYECMESIINNSNNGTLPLNNSNGKMMGSVSLPAFQSMMGRIHHVDSQESLVDNTTTNTNMVPPFVFGHNKCFSVPDLNRIQMLSTSNASSLDSSAFNSFNSEFILDGNMRSTPPSSSACMMGLGGVDPATFPLIDLMNHQWDNSTPLKKFATSYMSNLSSNNGGIGNMQVEKPTVPMNNGSSKDNTNMLLAMLSSNTGINKSNNINTNTTPTSNSDAETFRVLLEFSESLPKFETDDLEPTPLS